MKQSGAYLARNLSVRGASLEVVPLPLEPALRAQYDAAAEWWATVIAELQRHTRRAAETRGARAEGAGGAESPQGAGAGVVGQVWAAHQRFWGHMCLAAKVPGVVRLAREALASGKAVVIGLQSTGESLSGPGGGAEAGCGSTAGGIMAELLEGCGRSFLPGAVVARLTAAAAGIQLPLNPLDHVMDALGGPEEVAEMTGRRWRQVRRARGGPWEWDERCAGGEARNVREREAFMAGRKLVAVISEAASTGISLHADRRAANQRRRVHFTMQLPWSGDRCVQQIGRTHRSNQASAPEVKILMTELGGEWRFAAAVAHRLRTLGAITQGDRRAGGCAGDGLQQFAVDRRLGARALSQLLAALSAPGGAEGAGPPPQPPAAPARARDAETAVFWKGGRGGGARGAWDGAAGGADAPHGGGRGAGAASGAELLAAARRGRAWLVRAGIVRDEEFLQGWGAGGDGRAGSGSALGGAVTLRTFLNRLLGVPVVHQAALFALWHHLLAELVCEARARGDLEDSIVDLDTQANKVAAPPLGAGR